MAMVVLHGGSGDSDADEGSDNDESPSVWLTFSTSTDSASAASPPLSAAPAAAPSEGSARDPLLTELPGACSCRMVNRPVTGSYDWMTPTVHSTDGKLMQS